MITLKDVYDEVLKPNSAVGFIQNFEGQIVTVDQFMSKSRGIWQIHIYSGSFDPLHPGHKSIFDRMPKAETMRLYELSINRVDKDIISMEVIEERLKQFVSYAPVLITNAPKFLEKTGVLANQPRKYFHIGADTLLRLMKYNSFAEIQGMNCNFVYYDRIMDGKSLVEIPEKLPTNVVKGPGTTENMMMYSSSAIRAEAAAKAAAGSI